MLEKFENFEDFSPEDRERMEEIAREAKKILAGAERDSKEETEEVLDQGKVLLAEETVKELNVIRVSLETLLENNDFKNAFLSKFQNEYGWDKEKIGDMLDKLIWALDALHRKVRFPPPDELEPSPAGGSRDSRSVLSALIAHNYGKKTAQEAWPLVDTYVKLAHGIAKNERERRSGEDGNGE
ncbi:MAG: hypothetical protein HYU81_01565 [Candidatus Brennerbacteria bacterium]|nr:hypothetical protein [Candidatus Brennerbacteria bacterium]